MKILLAIHEQFSPDSGSAGSTFRLGQQYEKLGHNVTYFSLEHVNSQVSPYIRKAFFPEFLAAQVSQLSRQKQLDVVDGSPGDVWFWAKLAKLQKRQLPLVVTRSHGLQHLTHLWNLEEAKRGNKKLSWMYPLYRGSIMLWEIANSLRDSDLVFLLNQEEQNYVAHHLKVNKNKTYILPNGIPESFLGLPLQPLPKKLGDPIRIAHIGTYIPRKGIQYSVPALQTILKRYKHVEVSFLGTGFTAQDPPEKRVYADFDPVLHARIKVVPQFSHDQLPELLKDHHIKLFPTLSEGFGKALIEAMACGLVPVTTDVSGPMEIVRDGHDALVVPTYDSQAIVQALDKLINNLDYLAELQLNAYATAQNYSWSAIAKQRLDLYSKALDQKRSTR